MKKILFVILLLVAVELTGCGNQRGKISNGKSSEMPSTKAVKKMTSNNNFGRSLVVYYSLTSHTKQVAESIHHRVGGDIVAIQTEKSYPTTYSATTAEVKKEIRQNQLPQLKTADIDWHQYKTIFVGSPEWYGNLSLPMQQLFRQHQFQSGIHIAPFFTSGSSSPKEAFTTMKRLQAQPSYHQPLGITNDEQSDRNRLVDQWLKGIKFD
ncbi:flavodoxin [Lacticaseibacillus paracasei]|uniref:flavodoxin n=1 Tax=Lacticaseibacillus paracasei TaxID=1597 RepID=UPI0011ED6A4A|nr:flavodoxin [Lacticaseibacillus paracasei]QEM96868.1 flavodoxin [Lacticaseibacillus paracasei]